MIALMLACTGEPTEDSGVLPSDACADEVEVDVAATAVGTAPRLTWQSSEAVASRVRFSNGGGRVREIVEGIATTEHDDVLVGILPSVEWTWQILEGEGEDERCVASGRATNGSLPAGLPQISQTTVTDSAPGLTIVPVLLGSPQVNNWILIFDEDGRIVWAYAASTATHEEVWLTKAAFALDGSGVYFNHQAPSATEDGWIAEVGFDGEFRYVSKVPGLHTDFNEGADGRIVSLAWDLRQVGELGVLGDRVVIIERNGGASELWTAFDAIAFDPNVDWPEGFYIDDPDVVDWTHVNSVSWNPDSEAVILTMTAFFGIAQIDAETGDTDWMYGDTVGDFTKSAELIVAPHSAQMLDSGRVLLFNRGDYSGHPLDACSWASEVTFDVEAGIVSEQARWPGPDCLLVTFLGIAKRLPGAITLVDWTSAGRIDQLTAAGDPLWSVQLAAGYAFGTADFAPGISESD